MKIFLDMDGVLADFVGAICKAHNRPSPYPRAAGCFDMEGPWGITIEEFWKPANNFEFWAELPKTVEADAFVQLAIDLVGEANICILTAPNQAPGCIPAKQSWIKKYYPFLEDRIIYGKAKQFISGPGKLLIDDKDSNIDGFIKAGGQGVLVPRLWNRDFALADKCLEVVEERLFACISAP